MKKLLTLALAAGLAAIATAENFRIDISGQSNQVGLVVKQMDDGITGTQAEWLGDKKDQRLIFCGPVAGKWEKKSFSFLPKKDGKISICLMGYENRADAPLIAYDDIKVNGQPLINGGFEASSEKIAPWSSWGKAKLHGRRRRRGQKFCPGQSPQPGNSGLLRQSRRACHCHRSDESSELIHNKTAKKRA